MPDLVDANSPEGQALLEAATPPQPTPPTATPPATPKPDAVVGAGGQVLEGESLKDRLDRERAAERKRALIEAYGTDDPAKIAEIKEAAKKRDEENAKFKRLEEARQRARLTASQRAEADNRAKDARIKELEEQIIRQKREGVAMKQDSIINETVGRYVRPERLKYVRRDFADHIKSLPDDKRRAFSPKDLDKWVKKFVEENPDFGIASTAPAPKEPAAPPAPEKKEAAPTPPPRTKPITTAKPPSPRSNTGPSDPDPLAGKTPRPGLPNSMNAKELKLFKQRQGIL
jgi:hypothetical protein